MAASNPRRVAPPAAVNKLLDSAAPSVEFTRRKYAEAHDAIVASAAYTHALEAAAHILHKVRGPPCGSPPAALSSMPPPSLRCGTSLWYPACRPLMWGGSCGAWSYLQRPAQAAAAFG